MKKRTLFSVTVLLFSLLFSPHAKAQLDLYSFVSGTTIFSEITIGGGATQPNLSGGNNFSGYYNNIPIGFPFVYESTTYTALSAANCGFLRFTNISYANYENNLANTNMIIAPLWDMIQPSAMGSFRYQTAGSPGSREFTAQWLMMCWNYNNPNPVISFQVKIFEGSNKISFIYRQESAAPINGSASIGLAGTTQSGGNFMSVMNSGSNPTISRTSENWNINTSPTTGQVYSFVPPLPVKYTMVSTFDTLIPITLAGGANNPAMTSTQNFNNIPIGFPFNYENVLYDTLSASMHGVLVLKKTLIYNYFNNNLKISTARPALAVLWDQLAPQTYNDFFYYQTTGSPGSRIFTAQWKNMKISNGTDLITFQVKLFEGSNTISFKYKSQTQVPPIFSASIGISKYYTGPGNFYSLGRPVWEPTISTSTEYVVDSIPLSGQCFSFVMGDFPPAAVNPVPANNTVAFPTSLNWTAGSAQPVQFKVYFDQNNPPSTLVSNGPGTSYNLPSLSYNTNYYWRIVPNDSNGETPGCPVWSFKTPQISIYGQVIYKNDSSTAIPGAKVFLLNNTGAIIDSVTTNDVGYYCFEVNSTGTYDVLGIIDTAATGGYNLMDALKILRHKVSIEPLSGIRLKAASVINPGFVSSSDALCIMKRFNQIISSFPAGNWVVDNVPVTVATSGAYKVNLYALCRGDVNGSYLLPYSLQFSCPGIQYVFYGGRVYNTVKVGNQCWMKENLNIGHMRHGGQYSTNNGVLEKFCYFNDSAYCDVYGGLYTWNEMMQYGNLPGSQGICPTGWHIPELSEFQTLVNYLGTPFTSPPKLKEAGTEHWMAGYTGNNESGFTALGAGYKTENQNYFIGLKSYFDLWSSTSAMNPGTAYDLQIENVINYWDSSMSKALSVRCIKD